MDAGGFWGFLEVLRGFLEAFLRLFRSFLVTRWGFLRFCWEFGFDMSEKKDLCVPTYVRMSLPSDLADEDGFMPTSPLESFAHNAVKRQVEDHATNAVDAASYLISIQALLY